MVLFYERISNALGDAFWSELLEAIQLACEHPERHHFDQSGLRRCNLKRFPVHFLFRESATHIRIVVIRHHRRHPGYGSRRK